MKKKLSLVPIEQIENIIYVIRGQRVMLDEDLARLYEVPTRRLNEQVSRNKDRFPDDFSFQLNQGEWKNLMSQFATSSWGGRRKLPRIFTEHGVAMLANVLKSERAALISIEIVRAFIRLRQVLTSQKELVKEVADLKSFVLKHAQQTGQEFRRVWAAIDKLINPPQPLKPQERMGFKLD